MSANKSFGGFGSGGGFGAFGGQAGPSVNNDAPVDGINKSGSNITAGTPNFNFNPPSSSVFNFSAAQPTNPFAQLSTVAPSQPVAQPVAPSGMFNFGAPQQPLQPSQPSQQIQPNSAAGLFNFGKPADATKPVPTAEKPAAFSRFAFGQPTTAPSLVQQPVQSPSSNTSTSPSPAPEAPSESSAPAAEMDGEPKSNPFAKLSLPPKSPANPSSFPASQSKTPATEATKPSLFSGIGTTPNQTTPASTNLFSSSGPGFSSPAKEASSSQPVASNVFSMAASAPAFGQNRTSEQPKETPVKPSPTQSPIKSTLGGFKPSALANETASQSQQSTSSSPKASDPLGFKSPWMTEDLLTEHITQYWINKEKLPKDPKARTSAIRDLRLARLNDNIINLVTELRKPINGKRENHCADLRPMFSNYIQIYDAILSDGQGTIGTGSSLPAVAASMPSSTSTTSTNMGGVQFSGATGANDMPNAVTHSTTSFGSTKRKADEAEEDNAKRMKPSVPTPESTPKSDTAKKLQSFLDSSAEPPKSGQSLFTTAPSTPPQNRKDAGSTPFKPATAFNPSTNNAIDLNKAPASAPFKLFGSNANSINNNTEPASTGFKPSTDASTTSGFKPSFGASAAPAPGGFKPASAASSTNFLAQFGQNAAKTASQNKKRAKDEDFDSDEDDEAEWEKNYNLKKRGRNYLHHPSLCQLLQLHPSFPFLQIRIPIDLQTGM
jgi:hypothetical protein